MLKLCNGSLYLKSYKSKYIKIANSVHMYDYLTDNSDDIHICYIDSKRRVGYALWSNGFLKKKIIHRIIINKKNLLNIKLYHFNDAMNIFIVESNSLDLSNIIHLHYYFNENILFDYRFDNLSFNNIYLYQSHSDPDLLTLGLNTNIQSNDLKLTFIFNSKCKSWSSLSSYNVNQDLINYCKSISYK